MRRSLMNSAAIGPLQHAASAKARQVNFADVRALLEKPAPTTLVSGSPPFICTAPPHPLLPLDKPYRPLHPDLPFSHYLPVHQRRIAQLHWLPRWRHVPLAEVVARVLDGDPPRMSARQAPPFIKGISVSDEDTPPWARLPFPEEVLAFVDPAERLRILTEVTELDLSKEPWRAVALEVAAHIDGVPSLPEVMLLHRLKHPPARPKPPKPSGSASRPRRQKPSVVSLFDLFALDGAAGPPTPPDDIAPPHVAAPAEPPDDPPPMPDGPAVAVVEGESDDA